MIESITLPVTFSTTIILFVTVSLSESKSPFDINFSIFLHPARSVSDSPDIFATEKQKFKLPFVHSCPTRNCSVQEHELVGKGSEQSRGWPVYTQHAAFKAVGILDVSG